MFELVRYYLDRVLTLVRTTSDPDELEDALLELPRYDLTSPPPIDRNDPVWHVFCDGARMRNPSLSDTDVTEMADFLFNAAAWNSVVACFGLGRRFMIGGENG